MALPVERWIVCVTGFRQTEGQMTGLERIQDAIHRQCSGPDTRVLLKTWRDCPEAVAERIWLRRPVDHQPIVVLIGYSWGGTTANEIAKELEARGIEVATMLLIDAVWRPFRFWPSLLSLLPCWTIVVPPNVRKLYAWRQRRNKPAGHTLIVSSRTTYQEKTENVEHAYMDELPDVEHTAIFVACPSRRK